MKNKEKTKETKIQFFLVKVRINEKKLTAFCFTKNGNNKENEQNIFAN